MKYFLPFICFLFLVACNDSNESVTESKNTDASDNSVEKSTSVQDDIAVADMTSIQLSQALLQRIKNKQSIAEIKDRYQSLSSEKLTSELKTDSEKKAFWINTYNGYIQSVLGEQPDLYKNRNDFFGLEILAIAGEALSFDDIEHGIIRSRRLKLSAGYLPDLITGKFVKEMCTEEVDPRIHFAVNCGARGCPPVHMFDPATIDQKLDVLTTSFLKKTTKFDAAADTASVTPLMNWFRADFDGKNSTDNFLREYGIIPQGAKPKISYGDYDWTLSLGDFADDF